MCEVAVPLDFGKALPEDVLKSVTRSWTYGIAWGSGKLLLLTPFEKNVKLKQFMTWSTNRGNLFALGHVHHNSWEKIPTSWWDQSLSQYCQLSVNLQTQK